MLYGGNEPIDYVWSSEPAYEEDSSISQLLKIAVAGGVVGAGFYASTSTSLTMSAAKNRPVTFRPLDLIVNTASVVGNLSPYQLFNTFRVPQLLNPFVSPDARGLYNTRYREETLDLGTKKRKDLLRSQAKGSDYEHSPHEILERRYAVSKFGEAEENKYGFLFERRYLNNENTYSYLKRATGLDDEAMAKAGLTAGMAGEERSLAQALIFEQNRDSSLGRGTLYTLVDGKRVKLSDDVALQVLKDENSSVVDALSRKTQINRIARSYFQTLDMWNVDPEFDPESVFSDTEGNLPRFMVIPSIEGKVKGLSDLNRRSTILRNYPTVMMDRFRRLTTDLSETVLGSKASGRLSRAFGLDVVEGPALKQWFRFGKQAAVVGAGIAAIENIDWIRRNGTIVGEIGASAVISGGLMYGMKKAGFGGKAQLIAGAASFATQLLFPGFDQGIRPGMATVYAKAKEIRALPINPFNYQRRLVEGYLPGASDVEIGVLAGVGLAAASYLGGDKLLLNHFQNTVKDTNSLFYFPKTIPAQEETRNKIKNAMGLETDPDKYLNDLTALYGYSPELDVRQPLTPRQMMWNSIVNDAYAQDDFIEANKEKFIKAGVDYDATLEKVRRMPALAVFAIRQAREKAKKLGLKGDDLVPEYSKREALKVLKTKMSGTEILEHLNKRFAQAEEVHRMMNDVSPLNLIAYDKLRSVDEIFKGKKGIVAKAGRLTSSVFMQGLLSFMGADLTSDTFKSKAVGLRHKPRLGRLGTLIGMGVIGHTLLTGGILGSKETFRDTREIHSGKKLVEVKANRYWEGGSNPFTGGETSYFRPSEYHLLMNRVREKGTWGEDEDRLAPIQKFFIKNFSYGLEKRNYWTRPYQVSGSAFDDVPVIGGFLSSTIGRVIKPPKLMHVDSWMRVNAQGTTEYASVRKNDDQEPAYDLGAPKPGIPKSPYSLGNTLSSAHYQWMELSGFPGFGFNTLQKAITGTDKFNTSSPQLASAKELYSSQRKFWEAETGGGLFMNEAIRRLLPSKRSEIRVDNPILNTAAPSWLPKQFHIGDMYAQTTWGEARLPGSGYAALHPELKGVDPEYYPEIYKYKILGDVAPYSASYFRVKQNIYKQRYMGELSPKEEEEIDELDKQVEQRYGKYNYKEHEQGLRGPGSKYTSSFYGRLTNLFRDVTAPVEYLIPMGFRPVHKLLGQGMNPIEQYEQERLYGSSNAFWDQPWRDWFRPALYSSMHALGYQGTTPWRKTADENQSYFDKLEFTKWMQHSIRAKAEGNEAMAKEYEYKASKTRFGTDPAGNPLNAYWAMPQDERKYFDTFSRTTDPGERNRILEMIPGDERHLYESIWDRSDKGDPTLWAGASKANDNRYLAQQYMNMPQYLPEEAIPDESWIGFHEDVDLSDVRVRYLDNFGKDYHQFGIWDSQYRKAMSQSLLEGADQSLLSPHSLGNQNGQIKTDLFTQSKTPLGTSQFSVFQTANTINNIRFNYDDNRSLEIESLLMSYLN